ncbi:hypothetical protein CIPAW_11G027600 [Carya illinoinensis]|uniref:Uncharacterized protein n=1 Tax=Carya illinoinensis TaxID=32201 RepID=A0A8T1P049_CARIL|nr:hypothetical protein CIPAW_11G027600 [Carya illinoinensis]
MEPTVHSCSYASLRSLIRAPHPLEHLVFIGEYYTFTYRKGRNYIGIKTELHIPRIKERKLYMPRIKRLQAKNKGCSRSSGSVLACAVILRRMVIKSVVSTAPAFFEMDVIIFFFFKLTPHMRFIGNTHQIFLEYLSTL